MKLATASNNLLEEARAAETSDQLAAAIHKIKGRTGAMIIERDELQRAVQDAIVLGREQAKAQAALTAHDAEGMMLEEAVSAFTHRLDELQKQEAANEIANLKALAAREAEQVETAAREWAETMRKARELHHNLSREIKALEQTNSQLEGRQQRPEHRASTIVRNAVGDIPAMPKGLTEYGRRTDIAYVEMLRDNPSMMTRGMRGLLRGRYGEDLRDQALAQLRGDPQPPASAA